MITPDGRIVPAAGAGASLENLEKCDDERLRKQTIASAMSTEDKMRAAMSGATQLSTTEAVRDHYYPMFELLEPEFLTRVAEAMTEGAEKYAPDNWRKFDDKQVLDIQRHAFQHIVSYMAGDTSEDHLGHAACNIMFMMYFESQGRTVNRRRNKGNV